MALPSQKLIDFTISAEVSSRAYYEKVLQHPEWPGGRSGVTIGIGYDLGYASEMKIKQDWSGKVSSTMLATMLRCSGVTGDRARSLLPQVKADIIIPWDIASEVFANTDVPQYTNEVIRAIPKAADIPSDCLGVLFSIGYNRGNGGWTASGDRYREMRAMRDHIQAGRLELVAGEIRAMKRCWPSGSSPDPGLRARRDREANLWDAGLNAPSQPALIPKASPQPATTMPKPATTQGQNATAGVGIVGSGASAKIAMESGFSGSTATFVAVGVLVVVIAAFLVIRYYNGCNNPVLARAKDYPDQQGE